MPTTGPVIAQLSPAPNRGMSSSQYPIIADAWAAGIGPWTTQVNAVTVWMGQVVDLTFSARDAAAASASAAAQSVLAATHQVELATAQVGLAAEQVGLAGAKADASATSAQLAKTYAEAAGEGAGIPPPAANRFLGTGADSIPKWLEIAAPVIPASLKVGQISISAAVQDATMLLANGATRLQADYPELYTAIGGNKVAPPLTAVGVVPGMGAVGSISPDAKYFAQVSQNATDLRIYPRVGDGWGSVISFTLPATVSDSRSSSGVYFCPKVTFNRDSTLLAVPLSASPFIAFYKRVGTVWTAIASPVELPAGQVNGISFTADGVYCALAVQATPQFIVYKRSGDAFNKLASPASLPTSGLGACVSFTSDGVYLAVSLWNAGGASAGMYLYKKSVDTLTKLSDPSVLPLGNVGCAAFSPDGLKLFVSAVSPIASSGYNAGIYSRVGDVFTFSGYGPLSVANNAMFSLDGKYLVAAAQNDPAFTLYDVSSATPVSLGYFPLTSNTNVAAGVSFGYSGSTYMGLYLIGAVATYNTPVPLYRDGYPINPNTEFKVPGLTVVNSLPALDTTTKFANPQLTAYIKAKSA